jgi:5'(3')-deoxyribonucleotidase
MKLPILIDCDEVLADFVGTCLQLARDKAGIHAAEDQITGWNIGEAIGWQGLDAAITHAITYNDLTARIKEIPSAVAWLRDVEDTFGKDRVYICTSPWNAEWAGQRAAWLAARGVPIGRQIQMSAKYLLPGLLIDDALHHIEGDARRPARPDGSGFLLAKPWNKKAKPTTPRGDYAAAMQWLKEHA